MATEAQRTVFCRVLQQARKDAQISQRDLAKKVGVSPGTIAQWEMGETAPRESKVSALEDSLDLEVGTFARLLGFLPLSEDQKAVSSVIEALQADERLDENDRDLLATIYRKMIRQRRSQAGGE